MSNGTSRINFPGLKSWDAEDTATHEVEIVKIEDGGAVFFCTMIRNKSHKDLPFVIASIADAKRQGIWTFKSEDFDGVGLLAKAGNSVLVALCGKGKNGRVERIVPLSSLLPDAKRLDLRAIIVLKHAVATCLGKELMLSPMETKLAEIDSVRAHEAEKARRVAQAEARAAKRIERAATFRERGMLTVFTLEGKKLFGTPVTEQEWPSLNTGAYAVLVEYFDTDGKPMEPREWFQVINASNGNRQKKGVTPVTTGLPQTTKAATIVQPVRTSIIEVEKGAFEVALFRSMDEMRTACIFLNNGTYVALDAKAGTEVEIYVVNEGKMHSARKHTLLA